MAYHVITVTLENITRITDVKDRYGFQTAARMFNATVAGKRQYAVTIQGNPRLDDGMVVTAVLRDPDNWQTLIAWFSHSTAQVCGVEEPLQQFVLLLFAIVFGATFVLKATKPDTSTAYGTVLILVAAAFNAWALSAWVKSFRVHRLLRSCNP
jgi:hypothetical protein